MTRSAIPRFDPDKAQEALESMDLTGVRHKQAIRDFSRLCHMRTVRVVPPTDPEFIACQDTLWPHLAPVMARQRANGAWAPLERDRTGWFHTTPWILVFFGYLGIHGTRHPGIVKAVTHFCAHLTVDSPATYACRYAMFLRALLQLGFDDERVRRACTVHVAWVLTREAHCRATTRRGCAHCACASVKELLMLNAFPAPWRDARYTRAVAAVQGRLLASLDTLSRCPGKGRQWDEYGYFRHVCPSWFEAVEALVGSGLRDREALDPMLARIGARCVEGRSWICDYRAHRSVLLEGKRRTVSWPINLEPMRKSSPWLAIRALVIDRGLRAG